jgi:hypothetical protein
LLVPASATRAFAREKGVHHDFNGGSVPKKEFPVDTRAAGREAYASKHPKECRGLREAFTLAPASSKVWTNFVSERLDAAISAVKPATSISLHVIAMHSAPSNRNNR